MKPINKTLTKESLHALKVTKQFRQAIQNKLIDSLGYFCSYCEIPLGGYQIEHHKYSAKLKQKISADDWDDLLLICKDCRDHIKTPKLKANDKEQMLWPDEDLTFSLNEKSPFIYLPKQVTYRVVEEENTIEENIIELVFILPNPKADKQTQQKAQNTIDHFQLNMKKEYHSNNSGILTVPKYDHYCVLDNRTFERTRAWKIANENAERYKIMKEHLTPINRLDILDAFKKQITANAFFKGNWSIWMTVFWQHFKEHDLLTELFVKDEHFFGKVRF